MSTTIMSFTNLGKVSNALKLLEEIQDEGYIPNIGKIMQHKLGGLSIDDTAKALSKFGYSGDEMASRLVELGFDFTKAAEAAASLNNEGKSLGNIFSGLGATIKGFFLSPLGKATVAIAAVAAAAKLLDAAITIG